MNVAALQGTHAIGGNANKQKHYMAALVKCILGECSCFKEVLEVPVQDTSGNDKGASTEPESMT